MSELNENISVTVDDAPVATVPLVNNLTADNAAPKASTVGAALALKADAATIMENVTITVDGQESDAQGVILLYGSDIPIDESTNAPDIKTAVEAVEGKLYGDQLPMSGTDATKISAAIASAAARTASDITYASGSADTIADKVGGVDSRLQTVEGKYLKSEAQELDVTQKGAVRTNLGLGAAATYGVAADTSTGTAGVSVLDAKVGADLQTGIDTLSGNFSSLFQTVTYSFSYESLGAGDNHSFTATDLEMAPITGYIPVAILSFVTGYPNVVMTRYNLISGGTYTLTIKNHGSSTLSGSGSITVLYIRTAAVAQNT